MKRDDRRCLISSRGDMAPAMSVTFAMNSAVRFDYALRFAFFGFWFTKIPIRES